VEGQAKLVFDTNESDVSRGAVVSLKEGAVNEGYRD
jgi:hypothetical protein